MPTFQTINGEKKYEAAFPAVRESVIVDGAERVVMASLPNVIIRSSPTEVTEEQAKHLRKKKYFNRKFTEITGAGQLLAKTAAKKPAATAPKTTVAPDGTKITVAPAAPTAEVKDSDGGTAVGENAPPPVPDELLSPIEGVTTKQEAVEELAKRDVDVSPLGSLSNTTTDAIDEFARNNGYRFEGWPK